VNTKTVNVFKQTTYLHWVACGVDADKRKVVPKWSLIADEVGLSVSACHMLYYGYRRHSIRNRRRYFALLAVLQRDGVPKRRPPALAKKNSLTINGKLR